ncbi:MAG: endonuclease/exonuclease/phosphatase family protein [Coprobacter sp.]|nr:endonuclease/exonuclease/phosphatase family protein [Coprobacter sp.]
MTYLTLTVTANTVFAGLLMVSAYAHLVSPAKVMFPSYLGLAFPAFLIINLLFVLFWALQRRRFWGISVLALLVCLPQISIYSPMGRRVPADKVRGDSLVILSYNIESFQQLKPHLEDSPNEILEYVANSGADIICMQEFVFGNSKRFISEEQINEALSDYPYHCYSRNSAQPYTGSGIACYSKYPITDVRKVEYESDYNSSYVYRIQVGERELVLINNHLESNRFAVGDRAMYQQLLEHFDTELIGAVSSRLAPKMTVASALRASQAEAVSRIVKESGDNIVVCGDFNDSPQSYVYHKIRGNLNDAYVKTGFGPGITYHKNGFLFRIDYILYGRAFDAVSTEIGRLKNSDHYPLKATLVWREVL